MSDPSADPAPASVPTFPRWKLGLLVALASVIAGQRLRVFPVEPRSGDADALRSPVAALFPAAGGDGGGLALPSPRRGIGRRQQPDPRPDPRSRRRGAAADGAAGVVRNAGDPSLRRLGRARGDGGADGRKHRQRGGAAFRAGCRSTAGPADGGDGGGFRRGLRHAAGRRGVRGRGGGGRPAEIPGAAGLPAGGLHRRPDLPAPGESGTRTITSMASRRRPAGCGDTSIPCCWESCAGGGGLRGGEPAVRGVLPPAGGGFETGGCPSPCCGRRSAGWR